MILADSSVWIEHLRRTDAGLQAVLEAGLVLIHPFVIGELALGHLRSRATMLSDLQSLPQAVLVDHEEVLHFIEYHALHGLGIGYVDAHLLASARLSAARLWTHDKRLKEAAIGLNIAYSA